MILEIDIYTKAQETKLWVKMLRKYNGNLVQESLRWVSFRRQRNGHWTQSESMDILALSAPIKMQWKEKGMDLSKEWTLTLWPSRFEIGLEILALIQYDVVHRVFMAIWQMSIPLRSGEVHCILHDLALYAMQNLMLHPCTSYLWMYHWHFMLGMYSWTVLALYDRNSHILWFGEGFCFHFISIISLHSHHSIWEWLKFLLQAFQSGILLLTKHWQSAMAQSFDMWELEMIPMRAPEMIPLGWSTENDSATGWLSGNDSA